MKSITFFATVALLILNSFAYSRNGLSINYIKKDVTCANAHNGSIQLEISGGSKPYSINWKHGADGMELKNLRGGAYTVQVTDGKGQMAVQEVFIEEPLPLGFYYNTKNLTSAAQFNGVMDISVFGGSPLESENEENYLVRLNGKSALERPENLEDGVYILSIEDARGCTLSLNVNLHIEVVKSIPEVTEIKNDICFKQENVGSVNLFVLHHDLIHSSLPNNDRVENTMSLRTW